MKDEAVGCIGCLGKLFVLAVAIGLIALLLFAEPYFKMRAYNKISDVKITLIDAIFSDIRIVPVKNAGE